MEYFIHFFMHYNFVLFSSHPANDCMLYINQMNSTITVALTVSLYYPSEFIIVQKNTLIICGAILMLNSVVNVIILSVWKWINQKTAVSARSKMTV